jgi:hypothetical protein
MTDLLDKNVASVPNAGNVFISANAQVVTIKPQPTVSTVGYENKT